MAVALPSRLPRKVWKCDLSVTNTAKFAWVCRQPETSQGCQTTPYISMGYKSKTNYSEGAALVLPHQGILCRAGAEECSGCSSPTEADAGVTPKCFLRKEKKPSATPEGIGGPMLLSLPLCGERRPTDTTTPSIPHGGAGSQHECQAQRSCIMWCA